MPKHISKLQIPALSGLALILFLAAFAYAEFDLESQMPTLQDQYVGYPLPKPLSNYVGDETINLHITSNASEQIIFGLQTQKSRIIALEPTELPGSDIDIYTSQQTITMILTNSDPLQQLSHAIGDGRIDYTAHGFFNKIKYFFLVSTLKRHTAR